MTCRHALRAAGGNTRRDASFLHGEVDRFAPLVRLVVVAAASVEAQIAAKGGHIANVRRGDLRRSLRQRGCAVAKARIRNDVGEREAGAEPSAGIVEVNGMPGVDVAEAQQRTRGLLARLAFWESIGA